MMDIAVATASPDDPDVTRLVTTHERYCTAFGPPESNHALEPDALGDPAVTLWGAWHDGTLAGIGALRQLPSGDCGEIKAMHTANGMRGLGVGAAILSAILAEAERRGYRGLYLETGSQPAFGPARNLYQRSGFVPCEPFVGYREDPHSAFFMKPLAGSTSPS